jgi:hypothetical protein
MTSIGEHPIYRMLRRLEINYHRMIEVIFHDAVSMDYLCVNLPSKIFSTDFLPEYSIENEVKPNISLLPFYCFAQPEEKNRYKSSLRFFKKLAEVFNIDTKLSKDEIIKKMIEKAPFFKKIDIYKIYLY